MRMRLLYPSESDFPYEEEVLRDPLKLQAWRRYLASLAGATPQKRFSIYERAVRALPGSYKLWRDYLGELLDAAQPLPISDPCYASLNSAFERALLTMHKMPRIWLMYLTSLTAQRRVTRARRAFDRALRSLPVSQHARVWPLYLRLVSLPGVPLETAVRVHRRYLAFDPSHLEDFVQLLLRSSRRQEAVTRLAAALNDDGSTPPFCSVKGKTRRARPLRHHRPPRRRHPNFRAECRSRPPQRHPPTHRRGRNALELPRRLLRPQGALREGAGRLRGRPQCCFDRPRLRPHL